MLSLTSLAGYKYGEDMKIVISDRAPLNGGIHTYNEILIDGVSKQNDISLAIYSDHRAYRYFNSKGLPNFKGLSNLCKNFVANEIMFPKFIKQNNPDLVHITESVGVPSVCSYPILLTLHDLIPIKMPKVHNSAFNWRWRKRVAYAVNKATTIATVSEASKRDIIEYFGIDHHRVYVTPMTYNKLYCVDNNIDLFKKIARKYNITKPYFLSMGGRAVSKNYQGIHAAFNLLDDNNYQLVAVGRGFSDIEKSNDNIIYPGFVAEDELKVLYNFARALVFVSLYEGFGTPILEAMACGTPVITSNISSMPEVAGDAAILVDPFAPQDIAKAMRRLIDDDSLSCELSARGLERVKLFSKANFIDKTIEAYMATS